MLETDDGSHQQLLHRLRAGDMDAYRDLLDQYAQKMLVTALRHTPTQSPTDAYDIVQQVFLALFQRIQELPEDEEFRLGTYLHRLTINACIDHQKRRLHRREVREVPIEEANQIPDDNDDIERIDAERSISRALAGLSEQDRMIVQMRMNHHSMIEIGQALGVHPGAARMRYVRAITAMRQKLEHARAKEIK